MCHRAAFIAVRPRQLPKARFGRQASGHTATSLDGQWISSREQGRDQIDHASVGDPLRKALCSTSAPHEMSDRITRQRLALITDATHRLLPPHPTACHEPLRPVGARVFAVSYWVRHRWRVVICWAMAAA
jgi:hypothetical protein